MGTKVLCDPSRTYVRVRTYQMNGTHGPHAPAKCEHLSLDMRLLVQDEIQQGTVDVDAAVVVNE
jgi:hypothetical protein